MSNPLPFTYVIGLEVHCELGTKTKMFCRCSNAPFGAQPNEHTCPICMGLPGTLPVPNEEAVRMTILVGKALGSTIPQLSKWDRKHYFYPDLPKGELALLGADAKPESVIRFERVHLEEDAGKLMHGVAGYTKVDLNRAGVPLIEMVSKPDLRSPEQARRFMQELQLMVRTLGVSDADMEKGQMRCDVNVSIKFTYEGEEVWTPITEVKNVNSTRAVERSLIAEGQRLYDEWLAGGPVRTRKGKLTAGWDEDAGTVNINRAKEAAHEYRYFPEPDIPPIEVYKIAHLNPETMELPELPNARRARYVAEGLLMADVETLISDPVRLARLEALLASGTPMKQVANWLINAAECIALDNGHLLELMKLVAAGEVPFAGAKSQIAAIQEKLAQEPVKPVREIVKELGLLQEHDDSVVQLAIADVLKANPQVLEQWRAGETKILGFLTGQVMKKAAGKAQAAKVQEALRNTLDTQK